MAAKTKDALIAITQKEFQKLEKTLADISETQALTPHPEEGQSIKDTLYHRTHWIGLFLSWYETGETGKTVHVPAKGYKWNQLKPYNAKVIEQGRALPWSQVHEDFQSAHQTLLAFIEAQSEDALYGPPSRDWMNTWTLGRWAEASGPSHYRSAHKYIREILRKTQNA